MALGESGLNTPAGLASVLPPGGIGTPDHHFREAGPGGCPVVVYTAMAEDLGVSINGGIPRAGWFVRENPDLKWIVTRGTPFMDTPIDDMYDFMIFMIHHDSIFGAKKM